MTNRALLLFLLIIFATSCRREPLYQSVVIGLNDNWEFRKVGNSDWLPARVPGNVISDLLINDKVEDPYYRDNELKLRWIENEDWEYRTVFDTPQDILKDDQVVLRFAGLDTYADIYLNDSLVLKADNMFRSWELPCKGKLKERNNVLLICFHSATKVGMQKQKALAFSLPSEGEKAPDGEKTSMFTRKAQFQFGSDFGPRLVSCGIWKPISLCAWNKVRIKEVHLEPQKISTDVADYNAIVNIEAFKQGNYDVSFFIDDKPIGNPFKVKLEKGLNNEVFNFQISKPSLWWCNGMGSHYLYSLHVKILELDKEITEVSQRFGVRKLELVQDSDAYGNSFYFRLNGVPVFAKGAMYVPPDIQNLQVSSSRYEKLVLDATQANMNMIRIWGGGVYESDTLYDLCDKYGLLVWQDFMFSRTMQPGNREHMDNIKIEAIENVKRLSNHPCIALWCGNDEGLLAWNKWGWKNQYPKDISNKIWSDYEALYHKMLRRVVENYASQTPYWSSSPSALANKMPDKRSGDEHEWRIWSGMAPFSAYGDKPGRFVSAFGMQSFPSLRTQHMFASDTDLEVHSRLMDFRQRSNASVTGSAMNGNQMIVNYIQMYYNDPADYESFVYTSQVMQAEALKTGIEAHRIHRPRCMGSLYQQLNDTWPTISWSTVDFYGRWKPAHYTVRRSFVNVLVVPRLSNNYLKVFAVNDSVLPMNAELHLSLADFSGKQLWNEVDSVSLQPDSVKLLWKALQDKVCPRMMNSKVYMLVQLVVKQKAIAENLLYFTDPKFLDLPMPDISYQVKGKGDAFELVLVSDKLAKNVVLDTYEKDSHFSDNNFDLLPGRELKLTVTYPGTQEELLNDLKIYSLANSY